MLMDVLAHREFSTKEFEETMYRYFCGPLLGAWLREQNRRDLDELVRLSVERFNRMSREDQERELRMQQESWVRGQLDMGND